MIIELYYHIMIENVGEEYLKPFNYVQTNDQ